MPLLDSDDTLAEVPAGSFGFTDPFVAAGMLPGPMRLEPRGPTESFEVHKLQNGGVLLVGYAGPESQNRLRVGLDGSDQVTIYSDKWTGATLPVAYPLAAVQCGDPRALYPATTGYKPEFIYALDCQARKKP